MLIRFKGGMVNKSSHAISFRWLTKAYIMAQCSFVVLLGRRSNVLTSAFTSISSCGLARNSVHSINTLTRTPQRLSSSLLTAVNNGPEKSTRRPLSSNNGASRHASTLTNDDDEDLFAAMDSLLNLDKGGSNNAANGASPKSISPDNDKFDYRDPEFLSTANPHWIEAGLPQKIIDVLSAKGITHLTPVQGEAFGPVLARRDVIGRSRTGTGKTLAFGLPALTRLVEFTKQNGKRHPETGQMRRGRTPSMLVLCPTRELAKQVQESLQSVATPYGLTTEVFHGGVAYGPQERALSMGIDVLVGTPGRVIDHLERQNLDLSGCDVVVLDEADEMLNMGFADSVETILQGVGKNNPEQTQCLLFSATTPPWVKSIGRKYQNNVLAIDSTGEEGGARVAKTVRHLAIRLPGDDAKKGVLEDIIAVEIAKSIDSKINAVIDESNPIAAAAIRKMNSTSTMQQKLYGKTIVFTQTKREADELVSGKVFKSLAAQALHGDVGQAMRESILKAFRAGAFNVLVATDVAARGIDISDVDLVIQFNPPRDVDTYVHRSGRTGRAGKNGVSILLYSTSQERDIVRIERDLGHDFRFDLQGPPSPEATLSAVAKTSALATKSIEDSMAKHFEEAAAMLLADSSVDGAPVDPVAVVAKCLATISRRSGGFVEGRSLLSGQSGYVTIAMTNRRQSTIGSNDVMFTVGKLSRMSQNDEQKAFEMEIGKIQVTAGKALFDMRQDCAEKLLEFAKDIDAGGFEFEKLRELQITRDNTFGRSGSDSRGGGGSYGRSSGGGKYGSSSGGGKYGSSSGGGSGRMYGGRNDQSHTGRSNRDERQQNGSGYGRRFSSDSVTADRPARDGMKGKYDSRPAVRTTRTPRSNDGW